MVPNVAQPRAAVAAVLCLQAVVRQAVVVTPAARQHQVAVARQLLLPPMNWWLLLNGWLAFPSYYFSFLR